jgi:hypothetical protein
VVDHRVTGSGHMFDETLLEGKAGMVGSEGNGGHGSRVYDLRPDRPGRDAIGGTRPPWNNVKG